MVEALVRSLTCPKCGAPLTVRAGDLTVTVVCGHCHSVLDAKDPSLKILQTFEARVRPAPRIPLGTRGKWRGELWEVIGYQIRTITVEGIEYSWSEYLLFNPYEGFRYLTEYQGHWNDVIVLKTLPKTYKGGGLAGGEKASAEVLRERRGRYGRRSARSPPSSSWPLPGALVSVRARWCSSTHTSTSRPRHRRRTAPLPRRRS